jgi:cell wall-active antibiotic response 4TMS protein YvqF
MRRKEKPMTPTADSRSSSRIVAGVLLLLVGIVFVLQNAGLVHAGRLSDWWPMLLVWLGLSRLLAPRRGHHFASGLVFLVMGIGLQLDKLGFIWLRLRELWPVLLVLAGLALISESFFHPRNGRRELS